MKLTILCFGITRDITGKGEIEFDIAEGGTVGDLKASLAAHFTGFATLRTYAVAVNGEYGDDNQILTAGDDIALIPPVSGG